MPDEENEFKVLRVGDMRRKYYRPGERAVPIEVDPARIPDALRPLIKYAEKWGIADDVLRLETVRRAPPEEIEELRRIVAEYDDLLDGWLAGPEADQRDLSPEYLAFTHMRMAADGC